MAQGPDMLRQMFYLGAPEPPEPKRQTTRWCHYCWVLGRKVRAAPETPTRCATHHAPNPDLHRAEEA